MPKAKQRTINALTILRRRYLKNDAEMAQLVSEECANL